MAKTDYERAEIFALNHRISNKEYQELVMLLDDMGSAIENAEKNEGKKTFFGGDKGDKYKNKVIELYPRVVEKIGLTVVALIAEGNIDVEKNDLHENNRMSFKVTEIIKEIYDDLEEFSKCYPNWPWAYFLYPEIFDENDENTRKIIFRVLASWSSKY